VGKSLVGKNDYQLLHRSA